MLERLAAWFLNTYVAEYVGNVVTDQLSIGLLKGELLKYMGELDGRPHHHTIRKLGKRERQYV